MAIRINALMDTILKSFVLRSWQFLMMGMAGWINSSQQDEIEYLRTENKVLREVVGKNVFR